MRQFTDADAKRLHDCLKWFTLGTEQGQQRRHPAAPPWPGCATDLAYNQRPPFPWLQVSGVIVGVLGLWGVLGAGARMRLQAGLPAAGPPEPRRLALFSGLLGGMFGTAAGHWIYDTLFVAASRSAARRGADAGRRQDGTQPPAVTERARGRRPR